MSVEKPSDMTVLMYQVWKWVLCILALDLPRGMCQEGRLQLLYLVRKFGKPSFIVSRWQKANVEQKSYLDFTRYDRDGAFPYSCYLYSTCDQVNYNFWPHWILCSGGGGLSALLLRSRYNIRSKQWLPPTWRISLIIAWPNYRKRI